MFLQPTKLNLIVIFIAFNCLLIISACNQNQTPEIETRIETVIVEREVEPITVVETVEIVVTVEVEKVVEKIVEVEVTPTPLGQLHQGTEATIIAPANSDVVDLLERRAAEFQEQTGGAITINTAPDLYQTILTDVATGQNSYAGFVYPSQWLADYAALGYLVDLTEQVEADPTLDWADIAPFYGETSSRYGGQIYGIPLGANTQFVYYRADVLEEIGAAPPQTWDAYLEIAGAANELDINQDGSPDFGSCLAKGEHAYHFLQAMAGPYLQFEGTEQGAFLTLDDLEPRVDNQGFRRALELYKETMLYSPPNELDNGLAETRQLVLDGRCVLTIDSGTLAKLANDPQRSTVQDTLNAIILPGATEIVDPTTGQLTPCDEELENCPLAIDEINHAPLAAADGWVGSLNSAAAATTQQVLYDFLVYVSASQQSNLDVATEPAFNPYRISQYLNRQPWVEAGMSASASANYLEAVEETLDNPNIILNLRIPQHQRYQEESLIPILTRYLADELTTDETVAAIFSEWQTITTELGREEQLNSYRLSLGIAP